MKLSYESLLNDVLRNIAATTYGRIHCVSGRTINLSRGFPPFGSRRLNCGAGNLKEQLFGFVKY